MFALAALVLITIVLTARFAHRWRLPMILISLGAGIFFGSDVTGLIYFDNAGLAKRLADAALVFVLFIGGFDTRRENLRLVMAPALVLSTLGVACTAAVTGLAVWGLLHYRLPYAFLLGSIIASTDAAAVFSILRSRAVRPRLSAITETESATNDPMAILLTAFTLQVITGGADHPVSLGLSLVWQLAGGIAIGLAIGRTGCLLFDRLRAVEKGYYYVLIVAVILLSFGLADLARASGILSAFFAGYVMGNAHFPYKRNIATFLEALSTIANVGIFILLGLLVFPHEFGAIWVQGVVVFAAVTFLARPAAVFLCTLFARFNFKEKVFISWSGLRGAVPIVLATYPAAAGLPEGRDIFNVVFFSVALSVLIQGMTIRKLADGLGFAVKGRPRPGQVMELVTVDRSDLEMGEVYVDEDRYEGRIGISSLKLPPGTTITMINRKEEIIAPQGSTEIRPGDVLFVLAHKDQLDRVTEEILGRFKAR